MKLLKKTANDMNVHTCDTCNAPMAKIDRRTWEDPVKQRKKDNWVNVCPRCDADGLVKSIPKPFLCHDGVIRTKEDWNSNTNLYQSKDLNFTCFTFSESALRSSIKLIQLEGPPKKVEKLGRALVRNLDAATSLEFCKFSEAVCDWGGIWRVWGKLKKNDDLAEELRPWFLKVKGTRDAGVAISCGIKIRGLGVSSASKHLRMLFPQRFAVLDSVLSEGLDFASDIEGYTRFMQNLHQFRREYSFKDNVATLESGIFWLVRQQVRTH